ncbi:protein starmaker-like isoform X2 [Adelges cooleyi]|uniref:protein starmaker-like isoform X2 n=1 Tax=Adelges cooleyi TaxID=133065 RepID=UPI00218046D1|nr:protein starmaker-like isoform X2 [Adelges cooleyi]
MSKTMSNSGKKGQSIRRSLRNVDVENINKELAKVNECKTNENYETIGQINSNTAKLSKKKISKSNLKIKSGKNNKYIDDSESDDNQSTANKSKESIPKSNLKKKSGKNNKYIDDSESNDNVDELTKTDDGKPSENDEILFHLSNSGKKGQSIRRSLRNVDVENINKELAKINECKTNENYETIGQINSNTAKLSKKKISKSNLKIKSGKNNKYIDDSESDDNVDELTKTDDGKPNENDELINQIDSDEDTTKLSKKKNSKSNLKIKSSKNNEHLNENSVDQTDSNPGTSNSPKKHKSSLKRHSGRNIKYCDDTKSDETTEKLLDDSNEEHTEESYLKYSKNKKAKKPVKDFTTKPKKTETADDKNSSDELSDTEYENKNLIDRELRQKRVATKRLIMNVDHLKRRASKRPRIEINYQED